MNTAHDDQVAATVSHLRNATIQAGEMLGFSTTESAPVSGPVGLLVDAWRECNEIGKVQGCPHLGTPRPTIGFLALVGELSCMKTGCFKRLMDRYYRVIPRDRCDACGTVSVKFHEITIGGGAAVLSGNVCRSCMERASADEPAWPADYDARQATVGAVLRSQGICVHCTATSHRRPHPMIKGLVVVQIQHDSWCPVMSG
jgi:hypothetical protein